MLIRTVPQADPEEARRNLKRICSERFEDYTGLSTMIGRSPSYLGRYVREGVPHELGDGEKRLLADYFRVPIETFGGVSPYDEPKPAFVKPELRPRI